MKSFREFHEELSLLKPILNKNGTMQSVQRLIKKATRPPKVPTIKRQITTMLGNAKAGQIRRAAKPE